MAEGNMIAIAVSRTNTNNKISLNADDLSLAEERISGMEIKIIEKIKIILMKIWSIII
jgi:hypothetical protein